MQTKEIISSIFVHGAQDSSSFILLHGHSKVFKIIYTNCPTKRLSGKVIVRETSVTRLNALSECKPLGRPTIRCHYGGECLHRQSCSAFVQTQPL